MQAAECKPSTLQITNRPAWCWHLHWQTDVRRMNLETADRVLQKAGWAYLRKAGETGRVLTSETAVSTSGQQEEGLRGWKGLPWQALGAPMDSWRNVSGLPFEKGIHNGEKPLGVESRMCKTEQDRHVREEGKRRSPSKWEKRTQPEKFRKHLWNLWTLPKMTEEGALWSEESFPERHLILRSGKLSSHKN